MNDHDSQRRGSVVRVGDIAAPRTRVMADIKELVDLALIGQHPKLCARCIVDRIATVFESHGAYDAAGVRALLAQRYDEVEAQLAEKQAAPPEKDGIK